MQIEGWAWKKTYALLNCRAGITPKRLELPDDEPLPDSETDNVKVFVRTRPINEREVELGAVASLRELLLLSKLST